jgi:glutaredoxin
MIRVIGQLGCSNCEITKQILKKKGIKFEYELMSNLPNEEQDILYSLAELKGYTNMPLIFSDNQLVDIAQLQ